MCQDQVAHSDYAQNAAFVKSRAICDGTRQGSAAAGATNQRHRDHTPRWQQTSEGGVVNMDIGPDFLVEHLYGIQQRTIKPILQKYSIRNRNASDLIL